MNTELGLITDDASTIQANLVEMENSISHGLMLLIGLRRGKGLVTLIPVRGTFA